MATTLKSDAECIQSSYEEQMGALFKQYFMGLASESDASKDQVQITRFKTGVGILRRAKTLALGVVAASPAFQASDPAAALPTPLLSEETVGPSKQGRAERTTTKPKRTARRKIAKA